MSVCWKAREYDPVVVAQAIEADIIERRSDSFSARLGFFFFNEFTSLLLSMLQFPHEIPTSDAQAIAQRALLKTIIHGPVPITHRAILEQTNRLASEYLETEEKRFVLLTSLSINPVQPLPKIRINGTTITFSPALPKYQRHANRVISEAMKVLFGSLQPPAGYLITKVHVKGRSRPLKKWV